MKFEKLMLSKRFKNVEHEVMMFFFHQPFAHTTKVKSDLYRATACGLLRADGALFVGVSICAPGDHDKFSKKTGRITASGRALGALSHDKRFTTINMDPANEPFKRVVQTLKLCAIKGVQDQIDASYRLKCRTVQADLTQESYAAGRAK